MIVPFGSAVERRSRTTYRPTVTPEESTHIDTFTGTTSSFSRTASAKVAGAAVVRQPDSCAGSVAGCRGAGTAELHGASSRLPEARPCSGGARRGQRRFSWASNMTRHRRGAGVRHGGTSIPFHCGGLPIGRLGLIPYRGRTPSRAAVCDWCGGYLGTVIASRMRRVRSAASAWSRVAGLPSTQAGKLTEPAV